MDPRQTASCNEEIARSKQQAATTMSSSQKQKYQSLVESAKKAQQMGDYDWYLVLAREAFLATGLSQKADSFKDKGNKAYQTKSYKDAIYYYSIAIGLDQGNEIYYTNRAAAHLGVNDYKEALRDANLSLGIKAKWLKVWDVYTIWG
eukprot:TRINITY_DN7678_c0_g1_i1.p2 TRINITY_DN7678_c0_g1~~TRINITY_DN7678_c0_g1_i1.p2  ORF type:complete len:147 (+),score=62.61 TRINITY_DN7678_c0_g1_i1:16-456(+)